MNETEQKLTIEDLAESVGISVRTVRFYITQGLIPRPGARGKAATYDEEHLLRLRLVRRLTDQRFPLAEIRERISDLSLAAVRSLLQEEERRNAKLHCAEENLSPKEYVSELLNRARVDHQPALNDGVADLSIPAFFQATPPAPAPVPSRPTETWRRLELAPGLELHVKASEQARHTRLIEQLLRLAGKKRDDMNE